MNTNVLDESETRVEDQRHLMLSLYIQVIGQVKDDRGGRLVSKL